MLNAIYKNSTNAIISSQNIFNTKNFNFAEFNDQKQNLTNYKKKIINTKNILNFLQTNYNNNAIKNKQEHISKIPITLAIQDINNLLIEIKKLLKEFPAKNIDKYCKILTNIEKLYIKKPNILHETLNGVYRLYLLSIKISESINTLNKTLSIYKKYSNINIGIISHKTKSKSINNISKKNHNINIAIISYKNKNKNINNILDILKKHPISLNHINVGMKKLLKMNNISFYTIETNKKNSFYTKAKLKKTKEKKQSCNIYTRNKANNNQFYSIANNNFFNLVNIQNNKENNYYQSPESIREQKTPVDVSNNSVIFSRITNLYKSYDQTSDNLQIIESQDSSNITYNLSINSSFNDQLNNILMNNTLNNKSSLNWSGLQSDTDGLQSDTECTINETELLSNNNNGFEYFNASDFLNSSIISPLSNINLEPRENQEQYNARLNQLQGDMNCSDINPVNLLSNYNSIYQEESLLNVVENELNNKLNQSSFTNQIINNNNNNNNNISIEQSKSVNGLINEALLTNQKTLTNISADQPLSIQYFREPSHAALNVSIEDLVHIGSLSPSLENIEQSKSVNGLINEALLTNQKTLTNISADQPLSIQYFSEPSYASLNVSIEDLVHIGSLSPSLENIESNIIINNNPLNQQSLLINNLTNNLVSINQHNQLSYRTMQNISIGDVTDIEPFRNMGNNNVNNRTISTNDILNLSSFSLTSNNPDDLSINSSILTNDIINNNLLGINKSEISKSNNSNNTYSNVSNYKYKK